MDFQTTIGEIMSTELTTVNPHTKLEDFENLFERRGFHHLPVENERRELVGIISTEDVNRSSHFFVHPQMLEAEHIMTAHPVTIPERTTIIEAVNIFMEHQFRALPVVNDKNEFVGLVTPFDLMKEMVNAWEVDQEIKDLEDYI